MVEIRADKESARRNAFAASGAPESAHPDNPCAQITGSENPVATSVAGTSSPTKGPWVGVPDQHHAYPDQYHGQEPYSNSQMQSDSAGVVVEMQEAQLQHIPLVM